MPHLSPMNWLLIMMYMWMLIISCMVILFWHQQTIFLNMFSIKSPLTSNLMF